MKFETKYDIGYEFFAPRVREQYIEEEKIIDGVTYFRKVRPLIAYVHHRKIIQINISISSTKSTRITYLAKTLGDSIRSESLPTNYTENLSDFAFTSREDAQRFADEWLKNKNMPYYGMT